MQARSEIEGGFVGLVERCLAAGAHVNIGTHDERLITMLLASIDAKAADLPYEVQMLFGVRPALQDRLVAAGRPLRIYTPFGNDWYGYYSRRLAERPANLGVVVRGMFG